MASRKVSDSVYYPIVDTPYALMQAAAKAMRDIFIVIQGDPDLAGGPPVTTPYAGLFSATDIGGGLHKLGFQAYKDTDKWEFNITFTRGQGIVEAYTDHPTVHATLIVDTDSFAGINISADAIASPVEPARVLWYNDHVNSVTIKNIRRLNGIEEPTIERTEAVFEPTPGNPLSLVFGPGHNTEWFLAADDAITLDVAEAAGTGRVQDYGDTVPGGTPLPDVTSLIYNINGLNPIDGNIPIITTNSLGLETETGQIKVVIRQ